MCSVFNHIGIEVAMKKPERRVVKQFILNEAEEFRLRKVAHYKGVTMSAAFRAWVNSSYNRLPDSAK